MKLNFCTLFNINYFAKGLATYESLLKTCPQFHLYIFAFDDLTYQILTEKKLEKATIIPIGDFESEQLLAVKGTRTKAEFCYTCTPFTVKYCLDIFNLEQCTYIDADLCFYTDPTELIRQMGNDSVLITPHNYYAPYDQSAFSGIYCVQFVSFKNNTDGLRVLNWWASACLKWCYSRCEDGKFGDQKYLDAWPYMFEGVHICRSPGAGMAPWNAIISDLEVSGNGLTVKKGPLFFYHFHALNHISNNSWFIGGYDIPQIVIEKIYKPYIEQLIRINNEIKALYPEGDTLNTIDIKTLDVLTLKYKVGIYRLDIKKSFRKFVSDLFFAERKKSYKTNYLKLN